MCFKAYLTIAIGTGTSSTSTVFAISFCATITGARAFFIFHGIYFLGSYNRREGFKKDAKKIP